MSLIANLALPVLSVVLLTGLHLWTVVGFRAVTARLERPWESLMLLACEGILSTK